MGNKNVNYSYPQVYLNFSCWVDMHSVITSCISIPYNICIVFTDSSQYSKVALTMALGH